MIMQIIENHSKSEILSLREYSHTTHKDKSPGENESNWLDSCLAADNKTYDCWICKYIQIMPQKQCITCAHMNSDCNYEH